MARLTAGTRLTASNRLTATNRVSSLPQNYQINAGTTLDEMQTGWAADNGLDTLSQNDATFFKTGTGSCKFTVGAGRANGSFTKTINQVINPACSSIWVYIEDVTKFASTGIVLYYSNDSAFTNSFSASYPKSALNTGWNKLIFSKDKFVATGTADWSVAMTRLRIRQYADGTNTSVAYYDKWQIQEYSRPKLLIDFDDNWLSAYNEGYLYMQPKGLKGNIFVIKDAVDQSNYMTTANLTTAYNNGWDLCTHGLYDLTTFSTQSEMETDILYNQGYLTSNGFTRNNCHKHYAYPLGGNNTTTTLAMNNLGYLTARTVQARQVQADEIDNALLLTERNMGNTTSLATAKTYIDDAIKYGATMRLLFHKLVASASTTTEWGISDFQALIDYIYLKSLGGQLDVVTISEWYNGLTNPREQV